jgi:hypothetical protein
MIEPRPSRNNTIQTDLIDLCAGVIDVNRFPFFIIFVIFCAFTAAAQSEYRIFFPTLVPIHTSLNAISPQTKATKTNKIRENVFQYAGRFVASPAGSNTISSPSCFFLRRFPGRG